MANPREKTMPEKIVVDWRKSGKMTNVKNQSLYGSDTCYATATIDAIETQYKLKFGKTIKLSIRQVVDYCESLKEKEELKKKEELDNSGKNNSNKKCHSVTAVLEYLKTVGVASEEKYNEAREKGNATDADIQPLFRIKEYGKIRDTDDIKAKLRTQPLLVGAKVNRSLRSLVREHGWDIWQPNFTGKFEYRHVFLLAGEGNQVVNGQYIEYGIVKSTWDTIWGRDGYGRVPKWVLGPAWYPELFDHEYPLFHIED